MRYQKVARTDLHDGVARQLRRAILSGAIQPGELLPAERDLAASFGVDRHTLRSALTELEQQALVQRRQGSGCRVLDYRETGTLELLRHLIIDPGAGGPDPTIVGQAIEVAVFTLQGLIDLVVDRADTSDLAAMRGALDELTAVVPHGEADAIVAVERHFFRCVWRSAHSVVAELLANTFDQIFDAALDPDGRVRLQWGNDAITSGRLAAYGRVIAAIEGQEHIAARELVGAIIAGLPATILATADTRARPKKPRRSANAP